MPSVTVDTKSEQFLLNCSDLSKELTLHSEQIIKLLANYETHETARDELSRSIDTLQGMRKELSSISNPASGLIFATFFPMNLPLYSLVLFGIAPSVFADHNFIRPPEVMREILSKLWKVLKMKERFPNISLKESPRNIFMDLYAAESDVIIFTGKYQNALDIHKQCPHTLLVYNGSGINPFLLFKNADVSLAAKKAIEMRCFNSGQDCAGPDAFFVPTNLSNDFTAELKRLLSDIKVGATTDPACLIGPTVKEAYITQLQTWLDNQKRHIIYGGEIDQNQRLVHPTIIRKKISERGKDYHEFFAPIFYILEYDNEEELGEALTESSFVNRGMYISIFGSNSAIENKLDFVKIIRNKIVNDVEQGNHEYGGYGSKANFLLYGDQKIVHPILISRDVHAFFSGQVH